MKADGSKKLFGIVLFGILNLTCMTSCGIQTDVEEIKNYKLYVYDETPEVKLRVQQLIEDYNAEAGFAVLQYTENEYEANCPVFITDNIYNESNHHVGWGQWIAETHETKKFRVTGKTQVKREVHYRFRLEFDRGYFLTRLYSAAGSYEAYDLKKLFAHEVGHGLQMEHNESDVGDVMYPNIGGVKNFSHYYQRVRAFFGT